MAKRMTQFYTKQSQNTFSQPIKIGTSAQYVTMEEKDDAETLKEYCNRIGDPSNLTTNQSVEKPQQKNMVTVLNETSQKAEQALAATTGNIPNNSIGQEKLKTITFTTYAGTGFTTLSSGSTISTLFSVIKQNLTYLKNRFFDKTTGGLITGNVLATKRVGISNGLKFIGTKLEYSKATDSSVTDAKDVLQYDVDTNLITTHRLYQHILRTFTNGTVESYKYGDGRLIVNYRKEISITASITSTYLGMTYLKTGVNFNENFPRSFISEPFITITFQSSTDQGLIAQIRPVRTTNTSRKTAIGGISFIVPKNSSATSPITIEGTINCHLEGRWK